MTRAQGHSLNKKPAVLGVWTTVLLSSAIGVAFVAVQFGALFLFELLEVHDHQKVDTHSLVSNLGSNGLVFSVATCASAIICGALVWLVTRLCGSTAPAEYLGFQRVTPRRLALWLGLVPLFVLASDIVEPLLHHPRGPDFTLEIYRSATFLPLLWFAMVAAAPAFEELFFRSFLLQGLRNSRLGAAGAIVLTSLGWALLHSQYSGGEIAEVFLFGAVLGVARVRTRSIYTSFAMHAFANFLTLIEVAVSLRAH